MQISYCDYCKTEIKDYNEEINLLTIKDEEIDVCKSCLDKVLDLLNKLK